MSSLENESAETEQNQETFDNSTNDYISVTSLNGYTRSSVCDWDYYYVSCCKNVWKIFEASNGKKYCLNHFRIIEYTLHTSGYINNMKTPNKAKTQMVKNQKFYRKKENTSNEALNDNKDKILKKVNSNDIEKTMNTKDTPGKEWEKIQEIRDDGKDKILKKDALVSPTDPTPLESIPSIKKTRNRKKRNNHEKSFVEHNTKVSETTIESALLPQTTSPGPEQQITSPSSKTSDSILLEKKVLSVSGGQEDNKVLSLSSSEGISSKGTGNTSELWTKISKSTPISLTASCDLEFGSNSSTPSGSPNVERKECNVKNCLNINVKHVYQGYFCPLHENIIKEYRRIIELNRKDPQELSVREAEQNMRKIPHPIYQRHIDTLRESIKKAEAEFINRMFAIEANPKK